MDRVLIIRFKGNLDKIQLRLRIPESYTKITPDSQVLSVVLLNAIKGDFFPHTRAVRADNFYLRRTFQQRVREGFEQLGYGRIIVLIEAIPEECMIDVNLLNLTLHQPIYLRCVELGSRLMPEKCDEQV